MPTPPSSFIPLANFMKQKATLLALLLLTSTAAPAAAQLEGGIGGALRRMPFFSWNEETQQPEPDSYELPTPIENVDEPVPTFDNDDQTDPMSAWVWAHTVDINTVKRDDLYQYGMDVRRLLAMRKLHQLGYAHHPQGTYADLSGLGEKGRYYLEQLKRPEIQALLATIAFAEGTFRDNGYSTGFGYIHIADLSKHPMTVWNGSSAAGRYQFMDYTWPGNAEAAGVKDFTPLSQDIVALHLIESKRGVKLNEFTTADFDNVMYRLAKEWASIPCGPGGGSCYTFKGRPQPAKPMATLRTVFDNGMKGELPKMGYSWHWWNDAWNRSMKGFQFAYEVKAHGDFDEETWRAVFDGTFGTAGIQSAPGGEVAAEVPKSFLPVSSHVVDPDANRAGIIIGGYRVTSPYGKRRSPCPGCSSFHPAWDLATPIGTPVHAPFDGIDVATFSNKASGNVLRFTHDGMRYSLLHMDSVLPGVKNQGDVMGYTGNIGNGTGPHLDVRVEQEGQWVLPSREVVHFMLDPTAFLNREVDTEPETDVAVSEPVASTDEILETEEMPEPPSPGQRFWNWLRR